MGSFEEIGDRVIEFVRLDGVPGAKEDDIAHQDFIFECSSEMPFWFAESAFDLAADAGDGADGGAFEFGDFEGCAEHVTYEGCVSEDFVGCAGELELFDDLGAFVDVEDDACGCYSEAGRFIREGLNATETCVGGYEGAVEGAEAVHVLWCVFEHAISCS